METNHVKILKELARESPQTSRQLSARIGAWDGKAPGRGPIRVNAILAVEAGYGRVRRAGTRPGDYHGTPAYLWELTPAGREWIESGDWAYRGQITSKRLEHYALNNAHRSALLEHMDREARIHGWGPESTPVVRLKACVEMHELGCTLQSIGDVFGVTREAIRLILVGQKMQPDRNTGRARRKART